MGDYKKEWTATCPRCDNQITHNDFTCTNCGKGKVKVSEYIINSVRSIYFGCEYCGESAAYSVKCPKCGASFNEKQVKTSGCYLATAVFGYDSFITKQLRVFRDRCLLKFKLGKKFVYWYYEWSPWLIENFSRKKN